MSTPSGRRLPYIRRKMNRRKMMKRKIILYTYREPTGRRKLILTLLSLTRIVEVAVVTVVGAAVEDVEEVVVVRVDSVEIANAVRVVDSVVIVNPVKVVDSVVIVKVVRVLHHPDEEVVTEVVVAVEVIEEVVVEEDPTRNLTLLRKPSLLWVKLGQYSHHNGEFR